MRTSRLPLNLILGMTAAVSVLATGVDAPGPSLPPPGEYVTPADVHAAYGTPAGDVFMQDIRHRPLLGFPIGRAPTPDGEVEEFSSTLQGRGQLGTSGPSFDVFMQGPVRTLVRDYPPGGGTGIFETEMLSMDLTGVTPLGPLMIRESPTLPSTGQTVITPNPGGGFHIDSFFDVFTELSIDGGQTWTPSSDSTRVVLQPVPDAGATFWLLLAPLGLLVVHKTRRAF